MWIKSTLSLAVILTSAITYGCEIYKWTDENGQVHYDNSVPKSQRNVAEKINSRGVSILNSQYQETAVKGQLGQNNKPVEPTNSKAASNSTEVDRGSTAANDRRNSCAEEWRRYRESQACFAPYAKVGGGVKGEAFEHCTEVTQPAFCN